MTRLDSLRLLLAAEIPSDIDTIEASIAEIESRSRDDEVIYAGPEFLDRVLDRLRELRAALREAKRLDLEARTFTARTEVPRPLSGFMSVPLAAIDAANRAIASVGDRDRNLESITIEVRVVVAPNGPRT